MSVISASVARQTLPAQLDRVEAGEEVEISRHGRVVAVLVRPDVLRSRRAVLAWRSADEVAVLLHDARSRPLPVPVISVERADELAHQIDADRGER